jgi:anthranilate synthase component 1
LFLAFYHLTVNYKILKTFQLHTTFKKLLADTVTPVSIFLKLRDRFVNTLLLESADYHGNENSFSYICCQPVAGIEVRDQVIYTQFPDGNSQELTISDRKQVIDALDNFAGAFAAEQNGFNFINNGLFGYSSYDAVQYFEDIEVQQPDVKREIPILKYQVFKYIIAINHFKNELYIFEHSLEPLEDGETGGIAEIESLIKNKNYPTYHFSPAGEETSNFTDEEFLQILEQGKAHCHRGDVFQIVLSRRFSTPFHGDEFNVYRALRSVNPSPYLFYFDYGSFKIFGSSPEAQIVIKDQQASIHPIAGTFLRSGNDQADAALARKLYDDPKENAEHVMLVDLARNDLSRHGYNVKVETFKEIQYYSHVIHLVSKVTGDIHEGIPSIQLVADTFPAGTLSGAPKHMAMQLINKYENGNRSYYGGCIGFMGFNGEFNSAIMIRSFLSKDNVLYYQAGAGVVAKSSTQSELQEVNNKLKALRTALQLAKDI